MSTPEPVSPAQRYCGLGHTIADTARSLARSDGDDDQDLLLHRLQALAQLTCDRVRLSYLVHTPADAARIEDDIDDARFAALLADLAASRHHGLPRSRNRIRALEGHAYSRIVMDQMASGDDQPGWVLAQRLNTLIDTAIAAGLHTGLAQQIAHAISHRPDGENAEEHENALDHTAGETDTATPHRAAA
ncbi:hypothetical protein [Amycolatopsis minnesotensis]|uniref:Uncharacterized protein n=1 Tax=Amycolatopsis minnesotensis TaxID=337894 RepID=A0ABN2SCK9_9PSEU